jgi:DNA-binding MarR family transcriptional regulator
MQHQPEQRLIGELLRNPNAARVRFVEGGLAAAGHPVIRQPHLPVFEYIDRRRGSRITYLAAHANITVQAMGELVDHLARHGYVERVPDPTDGRAKLVRLTAQGLAIYALAGRLVREIEATWTAYIGAEKLGQLKQLLAELWDAIEAAEQQKEAELIERTT